MAVVTIIHAMAMKISTTAQAAPVRRAFMNPAWALLRLASPQLPIGGYSYSQGLEMAVENGRVTDPANAAAGQRPVAAEPGAFRSARLLAHCRAAAGQDWPTLSSCANSTAPAANPRAVSRKPPDGLLLATTAQRLPELDSAARTFLEQDRTPPGPGWALAARAWAISPDDALAAWLWSWLENQLAVLMKTLPLGQQAAQRLTSELLPLLQQAQQDAARIDPHHFELPVGLPLACMAHVRSTAACSVPRSALFGEAHEHTTPARRHRRPGRLRQNRAGRWPCAWRCATATTWRW